MLLLGLFLGMAMPATSARPPYLIVAGAPSACRFALNGTEVREAGLKTLARTLPRGTVVRVAPGRHGAPTACVNTAFRVLDQAGVGHGAVQPNPHVHPPHELAIASKPGCRVRADRRRVTLAELDAVARRWVRSGDEVLLAPDPNADFECVDQVLRVLKRTRVGNLGFIGNEALPDEADRARAPSPVAPR